MKCYHCWVRKKYAGKIIQVHSLATHTLPPSTSYIFHINAAQPAVETWLVVSGKVSLLPSQLQQAQLNPGPAEILFFYQMFCGYNTVF